MRSTDVLRVVCWEDAGLTIMARVLGNAGTAVTQASLTGIAFKAFDLATGAQVGSTTALTVSAVVFDTLQDDDDDPRWTLDSTGFNFLYTVPATFFPTGDQKYLLEFVFDPVSGDNFPLVVECFAKGLLSS